MSTPIDHLINGDLELFKKSIHRELYSKVANAFEERKKEMASDFLSDECSSCGGQIEESKKSNKGGIPKTPREKELAAKSGDPDRITRGDVITAITETNNK